MIGNTLAFVADELNDYVCRQQGINPDRKKVLLSSIINPDGTLAVTDENVILTTLIDIREETVAGMPHHLLKNGKAQQFTKDAPPINLNCYVLFSSYFKKGKDKEALNYLTYVFRFFQSKPTFNRRNSPNMPGHLQKLDFHMETQTFLEKNHMWGLIGSRYMPSVLYKMWMLSIYQEAITEFVPPVSEIDIITPGS